MHGGFAGVVFSSLNIDVCHHIGQMRVTTLQMIVHCDDPGIGCRLLALSERARASVGNLCAYQLCGLMSPFRVPANLQPTLCATSAVGSNAAL